MCNPKARFLIEVQGCVQGVGFRPFVYRLAQQHDLVGSVYNTVSGVRIDVQGDRRALAQFQRDLNEKKPNRAFIASMRTEEADLGEAEGFRMGVCDRKAQTELALLPDAAICRECIGELFDPKNRRYRYPFLHCTSCGPRFSLFTDMPFDRAHTSMIDFPMCPQCRAEYSDPSDRRFFSQTQCCPRCGPKLRLFDAAQRIVADSEEAIDAAVQCIGSGGIVALKNTGGFLLLADATCEAAVQRLRARKRRPKKPFAVLMPSLFEAGQAVWLDAASEAVLASAEAPIVLIKKRGGLALSVAFDSPYYGVMLPHNALQHLLLSALDRPLVATSGNLSGMPICITEEEAFHQLGSVADLFLVHNRRIVHRMDDSIVQIIAGRPSILRRSRGYIPFALDVPDSCSQWLFGAGGHLKNSFAIAKDRRIYFGQHIGNLDSKQAGEAYAQEVSRWESLLHASIDVAVVDPHPTYFPTRYVQARKLPLAVVQHHRAHAYSCMLDNQIKPPFLSIVWDGTGLGDDRTIWGGEAFVAAEDGMRRFATLVPFRLPGGEQAILEPRRSLLGALHAIYGSHLPELSCFKEEELCVLGAVLDRKLNAPVCSSMGRLFDAVSALLGCSLISTFEGEAALALEALARQSDGVQKPGSCYGLSLRWNENIWLIEWRDMIKRMLEHREEGRFPADMALDFHFALADLIVQLAQTSGLESVLLTGGCMQNQLLIEATIAALQQAGFKPFWHHQIPPNDGGLAAGQIMGRLFGEQHVLGFAW